MMQLREMEIKNWDQMTNDEKLDRLTAVLTRAGSDLQFRERCFRSAESAREAVSEEGGIEFSQGFQVEFLTREQRLKKVVLAMPDYIAPENGVRESRQAEDYHLCTYNPWRS
jgi:predicted Fe-S protein YdhL (DUF1289 family)